MEYRFYGKPRNPLEKNDRSRKSCYLDRIMLIPFFFAGLMLGSQGAVVVTILPQTLSILKGPSVDLVSVATLLIVASVQPEFGRRSNLVSRERALRDYSILTSTAYLIFLLAPVAFWLITALILWGIGVSLTLIAVGRATLSAPDRTVRSQRNNRFLAGATVGTALVRTVFYFGLSPSVAAWLGILAALPELLLATRAAHFSTPSFPSLSFWEWRALFRDKKFLLGSAAAFLAGDAAALLVLHSVHVGPVLVSGMVAVFLLHFFRTSFPPTSFTATVLFLASLSLVADLMLWDELRLALFGLPAMIGSVYSLVRLGGLVPETNITFGERIALQNAAFLTGAVVPPVLSFLPYPGSLGLILLALALTACALLMLTVRSERRKA